MPRDIFSGGADALGGSGGSGVDLPPKILVAAALTAGDYDGQVGLLRVGTYPDDHTEELVWDGTASRWIGQPYPPMFTTTDGRGMDFHQHPLSHWRNAWARFDNGLPTAKSGARSFTVLASDTTLPAATIVTNSADLAVQSPIGPAFAASGTIRIRDQLVTYTGRSGTSFTGCAGGTGTFPGNATPITQGETAGWGTTCTPLDNVSTLWNAGLRLQERASSWINGSFDHITLSIAPYYWSRALGGGSWTLPPTSNPSGGLGFGLTITGPADDFVTARETERPFDWIPSNWTDWTASAPTQRYLMAGLYGKMNNAAALDNGEAYGYALRHRWVSPVL